MEAALAQVPALPGRTLILIDRSASMFTQVDRGSAVTVADQATVFGTALAGCGHAQPISCSSAPLTSRSSSLPGNPCSRSPSGSVRWATAMRRPPYASATTARTGS